MSRLYFPSLNGLRAVSIILVVIYHSALSLPYLDAYYPTRLLNHLLHNGQLGVDIFFLISGFLITSLLLHEEELTGKISLKNFYVRRILRIFPAYYFLLLTYFVLQLMNVIHIPADAWITALTFTKYFNWNVEWFTSHGWSLSIEEHFYLLWPLLFTLGERHRKTSAWIMIAVVPIIRVIDYTYQISWINELTIFTRIDTIATGCILALYREKILKVLSMNWTLVALIGFGGLLISQDTYFLLKKLHLEFLTIPLGAGTGTVANICIALIVLYSVFGPQNFIHRMLNIKIVQIVGLMSYSIYLWQQLFTSQLKGVSEAPWNLVFIAVTSSISYFLVEKPFLKIKHKFSGKIPAKETVTATVSGS